MRWLRRKFEVRHCVIIIRTQTRQPVRPNWQDAQRRMRVQMQRDVGLVFVFAPRILKTSKSNLFTLC
jgi:hypothetical protein